jgi:DNA-binding transcriptional ArsR family regulator
VGRLEAAEIDRMHARVCKALADPARLLIINELRDGPRTAGELVTALGMSRRSVSRHLGLLGDRGFVVAGASGDGVRYGLASADIVRAVDLLREFLAERRGGGC